MVGWSCTFGDARGGAFIAGGRAAAGLSGAHAPGARGQGIGPCGAGRLRTAAAGLAAASLPFLRTNLLGVGARVFADEETVRAVLDRPPLDVLLGISGLGDRSVDVAGGRRLELERAR